MKLPLNPKSLSGDSPSESIYEKPFIRTSLGFILAIILVMFIFAPFLGVVDRAPRPPTQEKAEAIPGFSLDPDGLAGYTIGEKNSMDFFWPWPFGLGIGLFVAISAFARADRSHPAIVGGIAGFVYLLLSFLTINWAPGFHYIPESTGLLNRLTWAFLGPFFIQGVPVGVITGLYSLSLVPEVPEQNHQYYQLHIRNTWRYIQALLTITIAGTVGILIPTILDFSNFKLAGIFLPLISISAFIVAVSGFGLLRIWAISKQITDNGLFTN